MVKQYRRKISWPISKFYTEVHMEPMRKTITILSLQSILDLTEEKRRANVPKILRQACISKLSIFQNSVTSKKECYCDYFLCNKERKQQIKIQKESKTSTTRRILQCVHPSDLFPSFWCVYANQYGISHVETKSGQARID